MFVTMHTRSLPLRSVPPSCLRGRVRTKYLRVARLRPVACKPESGSADTSPSTKPPEVVESVEQNGSKPLTRVTRVDCSEGVEYPSEKEGDDSGFFPMREPGDFPSTGEHYLTRFLVDDSWGILEVSKVRDVEKVEEYDPLRDGPLRYLGYANELGEAFAAWMPPFGVPLSYAVAVGYVLVDTRDKGLKAYNTATTELEKAEVAEEVNCNRLPSLLSVERAIDTVVWQLLASVIIPGYTIHTVVAVVHYLLQNGLHVDDPSLMVPSVAAALASVAATVGTDTDTVAGLVEKSVPTFCGLLTIPFIVHPIDETVHAILNVSMRPALRKFLCDNGQGGAAGLKICDETCMKADFPVLSEDTNLIEAFAKSFEEEEEE